MALRAFCSTFFGILAELGPFQVVGQLMAFLVAVVKVGQDARCNYPCEEAAVGGGFRESYQRPERKHNQQLLWSILPNLRPFPSHRRPVEGVAAQPRAIPRILAKPNSKRPPPVLFFLFSGEAREVECCQDVVVAIAWSLLSFPMISATKRHVLEKT